MGDHIFATLLFSYIFRVCLEDWSELLILNIPSLFAHIPTLCRSALIGAFGPHLLRDARFLSGAGNHNHCNTL